MSVVDIARRYIGSPYKFGGHGAVPGEGMDCSRFVQNVMRNMGVAISRTTRTQKNEGQPVSFNNMQPGDCIYYDGDVVMYIGSGRIIHASQRGVVEENIYDTKNIVSIRRFLSNRPPITISFIKDLDLYNSVYPELQKAFNGNEEALNNHLNSCGLKEGRIFSYVFDPGFYFDKYPDIRNAFGRNFIGITKHYIENGIKEGRQGSIVFYLDYYKNTYPDLRNAFGDDNKKYVKHFLEHGINEGRRASYEFDPMFYKNKHPDLQKAFGNNMKSYYKHYLQYGRFEGRQTHE